MSKEELWVDTVPVCDKDVISVQYNDNQVNITCYVLDMDIYICLVNIWI